jgi:PST family polysaccharide transporter
MPTLSTRILDSLGWVFGNILLKNAIQFLRVVVLWRILDAADFGLNQMAWLAINMFTLLQDMGFSAALIQRKTDIEAAISITWYTNIAIRAVVYGVLFLIAPQAAAHFQEPELESILRWASLGILISSFGNANEAVLRKNFQFRQVLIVDTGELIVQSVAQIVLALFGFGVWSLVYGSIAAAVSRSLLLWWLAPIRVGKFDVRVAKDMFHFAKHMTVSTLLIWLILHMDNYFVGKFLGAAALGYYTLAFGLAHLIATNVARLFGSVLFPAFAEVGHDRERIRAAWLRAVRYTMLVVLALGVGMIVFAHEIVLGFFPEKGEIAVLPVAILAVFAICRGFGSTLGDLAKGIAKPGILSTVAFWHAVAMAPLLLAVAWAARNLMDFSLDLSSLPLIERSFASAFFLPAEVRVGLAWVSIIVSGTALFGVALSFTLSSREVHFTVREVFQALRPSLTASLALAAAGVASKTLLGWLLPAAHPLVVLGAAGSVAALAYAGTVWFFFPDVHGHLRSLLERRRREPPPDASVTPRRG